MTKEEIANVNETYTKLVNAIDEMVDKMEYINEKWESLPNDAQDALCDKYPFPLSFDEMVAVTSRWHEAVKDYKIK